MVYVSDGRRVKGTVGNDYEMTSSTTTRWHDAVTGRFASADSIVPGAGNPQALNRYSYSLSNPIKYINPSGHSAIDSILAFMSGVSFQWSVTNRDALLPPTPQQRQAVEALAVDSSSFVAGRVVGGALATVQGIVEFSGGVGSIGGGATACGTGVLCPAGVGAVAAGTVLAAHGASVAIQGAAATGQQLNVLLSSGRSGSSNTPQGHHIATRYGNWGRLFQRLFEKGGMTLDDPANIIDLSPHHGPHSQAYHQRIWDRLYNRTKGLTDPADIRDALQMELAAIAEELWADPGLISKP
jgi:RHS repeat-associated protein